MQKKGFDRSVTVRSNWGWAFVFNKEVMGGGSQAEGHRQWVARIADIAGIALIGNPKPYHGSTTLVSRIQTALKPIGLVAIGIPPLRQAQGRDVLYSYLSATIGSTLVAARAGT
jgi:hypothetical protein